MDKFARLFLDLCLVFGTIHCFRVDGMWTYYARMHNVTLPFWQSWGIMIVGCVCMILWGVSKYENGRKKA